jgi:hypothetical protein
MAAHWTGEGGVDGETTRATIPVLGLRAPLRVLHISDSHIDVDPATRQFTDVLPSALVKAKSEGASLVVHTGDCIQGASQGNVQFVRQAVLDAGVPFWYISGNADWMDPDPPAAKPEPAADRATHLAEADHARTQWRKELTPLYGGADKSYWVREAEEGLTFVGVDNSTNQVDGCSPRPPPLLHPPGSRPAPSPRAC